MFGCCRSNYSLVLPLALLSSATSIACAAFVLTSVARGVDNLRGVLQSFETWGQDFGADPTSITIDDLEGTLNVTVRHVPS